MRGRFAAAALAGAGGVALASGGLLGGGGIASGGAVALYLVGCALAAAAMPRAHPHDGVGLGNLVTLVRLALTVSLTVPVMIGGEVAWAIFWLAAAALLLDGIDGWLARRQRLTSRFGARFDMEVDAALGLVLALNAFAAGTAGPLVLLLGLPRYLFAVAGRALPWLSRPLPERFGRKAACVVQIAALIAVQLPILPPAIAAAAIALAALALGWSFGRDILWLWRRRS